MKKKVSSFTDQLSKGKTPEARELHMQVMPIVESLSRQILELLDNEQTETYQKENTKVSGSMQAK